MKAIFTYYWNVIKIYATYNNKRGKLLRREAELINYVEYVSKQFEGK